jgi:hypothetical protein
MPLLIHSLGGRETSGISVERAAKRVEPKWDRRPTTGFPRLACACRGSRVRVPEVLSRLRDTCLTRIAWLPNFQWIRAYAPPPHMFRSESHPVGVSDRFPVCLGQRGSPCIE